MATNWDAAFEATPPGTQALKDGKTRIIETKTAIRERIEKEHYMDTGGTQSRHGEHLTGSAISYYTDTEPTNKPDGVTALDSNDAGRLWYAPTAKELKMYSGSAWVDIVVKQADEADAIRDVGVAGRVEKPKVLALPVWNMLSTSSVNVAHGLASGDYKYITGITIMIEADDNVMYQFESALRANPIGTNQYVTANNTNISIQIANLQFFQNSLFDGLATSRGWIRFTYLKSV